MASRAPIRAFMRGFTTYLKEPHPFERDTSILLPHKHDNILLMRKLGRTAVVYVPFLGVVLGWPFAAAAVLNKTGI